MEPYTLWCSLLSFIPNQSRAIKVPYPKCKEQEEPILVLSPYSRLQLYTIQSRLLRTSNKEQHNQGEVMFEESRKESS